MKSLKLALIHLDIQYQKAEANRKALLDLIRLGANQGAQFIIAPEMAISGYSFDSRQAIAPFVEEINGPTLMAVRELAQTHGFYACIGLALVERESGIFTNSVVAVDPNGNVVCRYNKINAESRWPCPGDPRQDNTFETPWGRVGLLICSDTYYGLMPRVTALRGAELLIVPSNWPPAGLDPIEIWRARALENGVYLAACNRTGIDRRMDCRRASSFVCDPQGGILHHGKNGESRIFLVNVPLTNEGRLDGRKRRQRMADRRPQDYHNCYLNLRPVRDLTGFLDLPQPGELNLSCIVPPEHEHSVDALARHLADNPKTASDLYLLPPFSFSDTAHEHINRSIRGKKSAVLACSTTGTRQCMFTLHTTGCTQRHWHLPFSNSYGAEYPYIDHGPARLQLISLSALTHPESAVAAAKQGCDLILAYKHTLTPEDRLLAGARTIEGLAVAVCTPSGAGIWSPPEGHQRWGEAKADIGEICRYTLDTKRIRSRNFQDSIDYKVVLSRTPDSDV